MIDSRYVWGPAVAPIGLGRLWQGLVDLLALLAFVAVIGCGYAKDYAEEEDSRD